MNQQTMFPRRNFLQTSALALGGASLAGRGWLFADEAPSIRCVFIAKASNVNPRNDTATVVELPGGKLLVAWHKYAASPAGGNDFGEARIFSRTSMDGGLTWENERMLVDIAEGDILVHAPALCRLPSGELLMACLRVHEGKQTTMVLFRSDDDGATFKESGAIWKRSEKLQLQGGAASLVRLRSGRLILPFMVHSTQVKRGHNVHHCSYSDDDGRSWTLGKGSVDLPLRGAMEGSIAELASGQLLMSLRTQLGSVYLSRSDDHGDTWAPAESSGLEAPEACSCLRRFPGRKELVLFWNASKFNPKHHHFGERTPLSAAVSADDGRTWRKVGDIETDPVAGFTNLGCTFLTTGEAVLTYSAVRHAWTRGAINLKAAIIPREWFRLPD